MTRRTQTRNYYTVTVTALHIRHEVRVHDVGRIMISVFSGPGCLGAPTCDPMGLLAPPPVAWVPGKLKSSCKSVPTVPRRRSVYLYELR